MDYNATFAQKYDQLNDEQRAAVDQIDGPIMVVAGPGTGKTQLLTMRVANILRQTDALPSNILCLTFTEAAATNMVARLSSIIGQDAYNVEINTFHGFGSSVINRYGEYFYNGASYQPADDLTQAEVIQGILEKLPFDNKLTKRNNDSYVYLRDLQSCISDFKKAAISPDELRQLLTQNLDFCYFIAEPLRQAFANRLSAKVLPGVQELIELARDFGRRQTPLPFTSEPILANIFADSLERAIDEAYTQRDKPSTKPVSAWKKLWCTKDESSGNAVLVLKDQLRGEKLQLAADVYERYLAEMNARSLYDFDDMIIQVIHAIHDNVELKANLQEQYQYILVDEFQDTNDAQMRLLAELTDYDDTPNLMVVGDDDQAIYRFQGADISNIQLFAKRFPSLVQINLHNNYRSGEAILLASQDVSRNIQSRLTNVDGSEKRLIAQQTDYTTKLDYIEAITAEQELDYVAADIQRRIKAGERPDDIAVIARKHASLGQILPHLGARGLIVSYEREQDILQSPVVQLVIELSGLIYGMGVGNISRINQHLPIVLASPAFGVSRAEYYKLSLNSHGQANNWLKTLALHPKHSRLVSWLKEMGQRSVAEPINKLIFDIIGIQTVELDDNDNYDNTDNSPKTTYRSPIYDYFFSEDKLQQNLTLYLSLLGDIKTLLNKLKTYRPDQQILLTDMLNFIEQSQTLGIRHYSRESFGGNHGIQLMTAHKAKGLEFNTVYVIDAVSEQWGSKMHRDSNKLTYCSNMPYGNASGDDDDERRRLLYVAMTRAQRNLIITSHLTNDGKELNQLEYLMEFPGRRQLGEPSPIDAIRQLETSLLDRITEPGDDQRILLANKLANYRLSATALNTFTDLIHGGPKHFLLAQLLHVPQATSAPLVLGNAIHQTMNDFVLAIRAEKPLSIDAACQKFGDNFDKYSWQLSEADAKTNRDRGMFALRAYLEQYAHELTSDTHTEELINADLPNGVRLTGKIDRMDIDNKTRTIRVIDYKTGKSLTGFDDVHGTDLEKAHRYKQQLMFYKLLIENSKQYPGYRVVGAALDFVEPLNGRLHRAEMDYVDEAALAEFTDLVSAVWQRIMTLDFPDTSNYAAKFSAILEFEDYLRQNSSGSC